MGTLKHRPASKFGENIWTGSGYTLQDMVDGKADPVKSWYTEIKDYPDAPFARYGMNANDFSSNFSDLPIISSFFAKVK